MLNEQESLHHLLDAMKNKQEFPYCCEHVRIKKLVPKSKILFGTWNIGTLTNKKKLWNW